MRDPGRPVDVLSSSRPSLTQAFIHLLLDVWHRHVRRRRWDGDGGGVCVVGKEGHGCMTRYCEGKKKINKYG